MSNSNMPKESKKKAGTVQLRHAPLGKVIESANDTTVQSQKQKPRKSGSNKREDDGAEPTDFEEIPANASFGILRQAKQQRDDDEAYRPPGASSSSRIQQQQQQQQKQQQREEDNGSDEEFDDEVIEDEGDDDDDYEEEVEVDEDGNYVSATAGLSASEEAVVNNFLSAGRSETRNLADIILEKLQEKQEGRAGGDDVEEEEEQNVIPTKVSDVFTAVGKLLHHYKSGKLPKALKMLPHLKNWEQILWMTRPDGWSPAATYATTRIFASNLNVKLAQRFYNLVLLEKVRDDIRKNNKLNYYLYLALKKALFKPAAFYKGLVLPLAQSQTCTLREATIIGSVMSKVSIPGAHSAAVLLRLVEMPYSGSTSLFIRTLLSKRYALPRRVLEALVVHFHSFCDEKRVLPVIWHQALLVFAQRYKLELNESQRERMKSLLKAQGHHQITQEVRRELFNSTNTGGGGGVGGSGDTFVSKSHRGGDSMEMDDI